MSPFRQVTSLGLAFALSKREVILITSQVSEQIGVPRPLRLKVHELGEQVNLKQLVDTTLKWLFGNCYANN